MIHADIVILLGALASGAILFLRLLADARRAEVLKAKGTGDAASNSPKSPDDPPEVSGFDT